LRDVWGEYRAPTGIGAAIGRRVDDLADLSAKLRRRPGGPPKFLVAKPGLDGHSNGAEQIAVAARDAGMEVVYSGIRLTPEQIAASARDEDPDVIGLSILSGSHLDLVPTVLGLLDAAGVDAPVVVGGIIPDGDAAQLLAAGVSAVYTPKDYALGRIMRDIVRLADERRAPVS
jgi:(2R)-ethylmalonyl-CoA mutase